MGDFARMDIFFFITSVATILLTLLAIIIAIYLIKILKDIKYISNKAKLESEKISEDIDQFRQNVRAEGFKIKHAINFISSIFHKHKKGK